MFDVVVVGGGPAGLSAALMLGRCRRHVLVCDLGAPRNRSSHAMHGYLSRDGIAPLEFLEIGRRELNAYGIECRSVGVTNVCRRDDGFSVSLTDGGEERARFVLIATGVVDDLPVVPGLEACYGRSVFHCPYCDGWEWRDRRFAALGRATAVAKLALGLTGWTHDIVALTNGDRLTVKDRRRLEQQGITIRTAPVARLDHDDGRLRAIVLEDGMSIERDALFFATGQHPQCDIPMRLGCAFNSRGTVKTGTLSETNVPGIFVAGDASRDAQFVIVAASEGVKAAVAINKALLQRELAQ